MEVFACFRRAWLSCLGVLISISAVWSDPISSPGGSGIPFYVGNMSVDLFTAYWTGVPLTDPKAPSASPETIRLLKDINAFAVVDYPSWCHAEQKPGEWDFSDYRRNADYMRAHHIGYVPFCWLHFPPRWYLASDKFVPYVNLATGESIPQISLWSPDLENVYDRFYGQLATALGPSISFIRLAMPSEYGEVGYCAGMTKWLLPQPGAKPGFWCGDLYARKDFRSQMMTRYGSLDRLNAAWGTHLVDATEIAMPDPGTTAEQLARSVSLRHQWLDFINWYDDAWDRTLAKLSGIVRKHFPNERIVVSLGYASEMDDTGNDESRLIKRMAALGLSSQSPANVGSFVPRRIGSACHFYGVPYFTEPPGAMTPDQEMDRIFGEISNGTDCWFDYPVNLKNAESLFHRYGPLLTSRQPQIDVALWHPTTDLELNPRAAWSVPTLLLAEPLRQAIDYNVVDDRMIRDGALEKMHIKCLVLAGARWLDREALERVIAWVRAGGFLVVAQSAPARDVEGSAGLWRVLSVAKPPMAQVGGKWDVRGLFEAGQKAIGTGVSLVFDGSGLTPSQKAEVVAALCLDNGMYRGNAKANAAWIKPPEVRGIYATRLDDSLVYYNANRESVTLDLEFRAGDFSNAPGKTTLALPPRSIQVIPLK
jgi:hypothetical protein